MHLLKFWIYGFLQLFNILQVGSAYNSSPTTTKFRREKLAHSYNNNLTQNNLHIVKGSELILQKLDNDLSRCGVNQIDIRELTIEKIQQLFKNGKLSSVILTSCYLRRIFHMNPYLKAVLEINPLVLKAALKCDAERIMGFIRGPLHGIPILLKDNIATLDLTQTTAGALAMEMLRPKDDSVVVKKLRQAGAIVLGKSNPTEWAAFRDDAVPSGWSGRGGKTLSPYILSSDPFGSSTGSAVAIAANLVTIALGTETDGSLLCPASRNSIVALKPTFGIVSSKGVIPISIFQDVVGPIARTVGDVAILMSIISHNGLQEDYCGSNMQKCFGQIKNFRIGVIRDPFWNTTDSILKKSTPLLNTALKALKSMKSWTLIDPLPNNDKLLNKVDENGELTCLFHEFKHGINQYLKYEVDHLEILLGRRIFSLRDIIRFNKDHPPPEGYGQERLINSEMTDGINNKTYIALRKGIVKAAQKYLDEVLIQYELDALVSPCDSEKNRMLLSVGAIAGYPGISVPAGFAKDGTAFGLCFLGRSHSDALLLKIGQVFEQIHPMRKMPMFLK